jgi:hypothetical protein
MRFIRCEFQRALVVYLRLDASQARAAESIFWN